MTENERHALAHWLRDIADDQPFTDKRECTRCALRRFAEWIER